MAEEKKSSTPFNNVELKAKRERNETIVMSNYMAGIDTLSSYQLGTNKAIILSINVDTMKNDTNSILK